MYKSYNISVHPLFQAQFEAFLSENSKYIDILEPQDEKIRELEKEVKELDKKCDELEEERDELEEERDRLEAELDEFI